MLGTSKLAQLNRTVFRPVIGTSITREEYDMCGGQEIPTLNKEEINSIKKMDAYGRTKMANHILEQMVDNGTVFRESRIATLAAAQQTQPGSTDLSYRVLNQLSAAGTEKLDWALSRQVAGPLSLRRR